MKLCFLDLFDSKSKPQITDEHVPQKKSLVMAIGELIKLVTNQNVSSSAMTWF
jgi:hypothetical protein